MLIEHPQQLIQSWLDGRARLHNQRLVLQPLKPVDLAHKCRLAYQWITEQAIFCPYIDIEYGHPITLGQHQYSLQLPSTAGYTSFALLPLLTLLTSRRLLLIGAPGRGKTTMATLMGLLAGQSLNEIHHAIQHGHPQLSQTDLLGSPLPSDLVKAESHADIHVAWRRWLSLRVKIIDEYNRIPTKTQATLLSLMAEGYAEMYEQIIECDTSAWFLTANDDMGGGTFQVIDALKDRIDLVVRCPVFNHHYLEQLTQRIKTQQQPEDIVPQSIIFSPQELEHIAEDIRNIPIPSEVLAILGFFISQLDFCQRAAQQLEFQNKDTLHLAGIQLNQVCTEDCPLDKQQNICSQTENGVSARAYQTIIHYAKSLAFFRGETKVSHEDIRQMLPWVLHERLKPNTQSQFFHTTENKIYQTDKVAWIKQLYDKAVIQYSTYQTVHQPVLELQQSLAEITTLTRQQLQQRLKMVQQQLQHLLNHNELNAPIHSDLILLKHIYIQYQQQLNNITQWNHSDEPA